MAATLQAGRHRLLQSLRRHRLDQVVGHRAAERAQRRFDRRRAGHHDRLHAACVDLVEQRQAAAVGQFRRDDGDVVVALVQPFACLSEFRGDGDAEAQSAPDLGGRMHEAHVVVDDEQRRCVGVVHGRVAPRSYGDAVLRVGQPRRCNARFVPR
jgi:hypothetical protein